jgi:alcohol dehydrogenase YqhD (iron-dependent ADH family)
MRDFVFENKTKVYFGKEQLCHLHEEVARKACGAEGVLHGFTDLTPADVENIFRMCL